MSYLDEYEKLVLERNYLLANQSVAKFQLNSVYGSKAPTTDEMIDNYSRYISIKQEIRLLNDKIEILERRVKIEFTNG